MAVRDRLPPRHAARVGAVAYWLLFWGVAATASTDAQVGTALQGGDWHCVEPAEEVLSFRRDVIASDPDWRQMTLLPPPGSAQPPDRYVAVVFQQTPPDEQVRDLRYVAARNRLKMFDPQA